MAEKVYLHLLLFVCSILCQGIFAELSDNDTSLSSDFLVRKRRVINHFLNGREEPQIEEAKFIVKIRQGNHVSCVGAILSHHTVITAALCVTQPVTAYKVLSGGASNNLWDFHDITSKKEYFGNPEGHRFDGISLITVEPPLIFNRDTGYIELYAGPLHAGTVATVFGWGNVYPLGPQIELRNGLRKITLPIMNHGVCQTTYRGQFAITDKHICTYCARQHCAHGDSGAPLVVNNRLAGIHVWKGEQANQKNPDVFINLEHPNYRRWIRENYILK